MLHSGNHEVKDRNPDGDWLRLVGEKGASDTVESRILPLRPGLVLAVTKTNTEKPFKARFDLDEAPIQFGFTFCGPTRCSYCHGPLRHQVHHLKPGTNGIFHFPKTVGYIERPAKQEACVVGIIATPSFLEHYFFDVRDILPKNFRRVLQGGSSQQLAWFGANASAKTGALAQILDCPYRDELRGLMLESRILELLALQIGEYIDAEHGKTRVSAPLRPDDLERIRAARDHLVADLEHPPGLQKLAAMVGVNERKLKTGFRQVFGSSVFEYFREYRMQEALKLLRQGDLNVSEVALCVGFQSFSHFSQAFRKRFGMNPKSFLASQSRLVTFLPS